MTITEDLKNVSEAALGKLAAQFGDLPRPLLAAIGAGDAAVERLVRLRDQIGDLWDERGDRDDASGDRRAAPAGGANGSDESSASRLTDATRRAQQVAEDVAHKLGNVVGEVPERAQKLIADLPAKAQEVANALSRENLRETVESYTRRVADVYRELADRGGARVQDAEEAEAGRAAKSGGAAAGDAPAAAETAGDASAESAAGKGSTGKGAAAKRASAKPSAKKPAGTKSAGTKAAKPAAPEEM